MKTAIFALFIALTFLNLSQAEVNVQEHGFLSQEPTDAQIHETAVLVSGFLKEFKVIVAQIELIAQLKPKETTTPIEIMDILSQIDVSPICESCQKAVDAAKGFSDKDALKDLLERYAESICERKLNATVCVEAVQRYGQVVWEALINRTFDSYHACERFHLCPKTTHKETLKVYVDEVLSDKPTFSVPTPTKKSTYTILHMTDPHLDLDYQEGTNAFCDTPLCCRANAGSPPDPSKAAGYWGTLASCDLPMRTFDQFLQFASKNFDVDMIFWTGDNIAHNIWEQSVANQTVNTYDATQEIIKYFPDTLIYPMFGNHEAFPCDEFDFVGNDSAWLTSRLADMWGIWLDQDAISTLRAKSYYAMNHPSRNIKIIALDTVACDSNDFYLIEDPTDPMDQLAWLRTELYDSEGKEQSVFIIGHINPGSYGCDSEWSARYRALIDRFTNIIRGQFYGHTHNDEIEMVRSFADNSPVGVVMIAPSLTTYSYLNPSFRIIEVDVETNVLVNYYQYRLDLDKWNKNTTGPIEWDLAYGFIEEYGLADMSYKSFDGLVDTIQKDMNVTETYLFNMDSGSHSVSTVDPRDVQHTFCTAKHSVSEDAFKCLGLNATTGDLMDMAQQILPGAWKFDYC